MLANRGPLAIALDLLFPMLVPYGFLVCSCCNSLRTFALLAAVLRTVPVRNLQANC
jgi:hypothetical protein